MATKKKTEKSYTRPADQVARKAWEQSEEKRIAGEAPEVDEGRSFVIEGHDTEGYVGVNPEYMNSASDLNAPLVKTDEFLDESQRDIRPVGGKLAEEQAKRDREAAAERIADSARNQQESSGTSAPATTPEEPARSDGSTESTTPAQPSQPTTPATPASPDKGDTSKTTGK